MVQNREKLQGSPRCYTGISSIGVNSWFSRQIDEQTHANRHRDTAVHAKTGTQLIPIICRFCICKFTYLLKFICNPNSTFLVICGHKQSDKNSHLVYTFQLRSNKRTFCLSVSAVSLTSVLFAVYLVSRFLQFC